MNNAHDAQLCAILRGDPYQEASAVFAPVDVILTNLDPAIFPLLFRYECLRRSDFSRVIRTLRSELNSQSGPYKLRQASLTFASWVAAAGGRVRGATGHPVGSTCADASGERSFSAASVLLTPQAQGRQGGMAANFARCMTPPTALAAACTALVNPADVDEDSPFNVHDDAFSCGEDGAGAEVDDVLETPALHLLELSDADEMEPLYRLLCGSPWLVRHYLERFVFPATMSFCALKLSASGQELGGAIAFGQRIGFSGTPSDLLPDALGTPKYEVRMRADPAPIARRCVKLPPCPSKLPLF